MMAKRILCSDRLRRTPKQFSWVDHRLVRDKHICGISHTGLALYLFLITVSDAEGLSFYSDAAVCGYLALGDCTIAQARAELCAAGLIAYRCPFYQVLSLDQESGEVRYDVSPSAMNRPKSELSSVGDLLRQASGGYR